MSVSSEYTPNLYTGNGATALYAYTFKILAASQLKVSKIEIATAAVTVLVENTDYTLTGVGVDGGGNITLLAGNLPSTHQLVLELNPAFTQETVYVEGDKFPAKTHEAALDKLTLLAQYLKAKLASAILAPINFVGSLVLPVLESGKWLSNNGTNLLWSSAPSATNYPASFSAGLDAAKAASPSVRDIYYAYDTNILYKCASAGVWTKALVASKMDTDKGTNIASASSIDLGAATGQFVDVTGTTTITALGTAAAGIFRLVRFTGALQLTHNGTSLILPGSANINTAANDRALFMSLGSGNWICFIYQKADGSALANSGLTLPKGYLYGLILSNNVADATNDLDVSAGVARDDTNAYNINLSAAITKRGDAAFSAGTGNGGGDVTGGAGLKYIYLIGKTTDTTAADVFYNSAAPGSVVLPAGWDIKRCIGARYWDGSAWGKFITSGIGAQKWTELYTSIAILAGGSATSFTDIDVSAYVADGIAKIALISWLQSIASANSAVYARVNGSAEAAGVGTLLSFGSSGSGNTGTGGKTLIQIDGQGIFEYAVAAGNVDIRLRGFIEDL